MRVRYDPQGDILYIEVSQARVAETVEIDDDILVDYDENGNIVGIEIWRAREVLLGEIMKRLKELGVESTKVEVV